MGHWEDRIYEIHHELTEHGLMKKFHSKLEEMEMQDHHRYKDTRERWIYAHDKIMEIFNNKNKKKV